ncbi:probable G-protein coupled receptor 160 [Cynoglossus semilaevis]|uniref:probable G-protein coupled receptor 160 n=1 Tax=Cynoglossus semilaevis TaxID=244447 RepID=UPI000495B114|nr:probable G-protein coupled receptor 160 [Cynoglossus semilaevis]XP_024915436.1 probable G-protein coupled receptor 160 [Cynoglossus semilaevis]
MSTEIPVLPDIPHSAKMLAVIEQWDTNSGSHVDNTAKFLYITLFKSAMDTAVFYFFCCRFHASFFNMCSLFILLSDSVMVVVMSALWLLGPQLSPVTMCGFMAYISTMCAALPVPIVCVGLLDYLVDSNSLSKRRVSCKSLIYTVLALLLWTFAGVYSFFTTNTEQMVLIYETGVEASTCEVQESFLVTYSLSGLFILVILIMVPFRSSIIKWNEEADMLSALREENDNQRSNFFIKTTSTETKSIEGAYPEEKTEPRPPMWFSLILGFSTFWMPYLTVTTFCQVFGFMIPAYISINLLWCECINSLVMGAVFWVKSKTFGPYCSQPDNVCLWQVYWHLSKGTWWKTLPAVVLNPTKGRTQSLLYV